MPLGVFPSDNSEAGFSVSRQAFHKKKRQDGLR